MNLCVNGPPQSARADGAGKPSEEALESGCATATAVTRKTSGTYTAGTAHELTVFCRKRDEVNILKTFDIFIFYI